MNIDLILKGFEEKKKITLDSLDVSSIVSFYYIKAGYKTVGDLWKASKKDLLKAVEYSPNKEIFFDELVSAIHNLGIFFLYESNDITFDSNIKKLNLSSRSFNILIRNCKIRNNKCLREDCTVLVRDVLDYQIKDIIHFRNSGKVSVEEIVTKIHSLGYFFNGEKGYIAQFNNNEVVSDKDLENFDKSVEDFSYIRSKIEKKEDLLEELKKLERKKEALLIDEARLDKELTNIINRLSKVNGEKYVRGRK